MDNMTRCERNHTAIVNFRFVKIFLQKFLLIDFELPPFPYKRF